MQSKIGDLIVLTQYDDPRPSNISAASCFRRFHFRKKQLFFFPPFFSEGKKEPNPVCEWRVNLLVYSLSLHRHSSIGFILAFASLIHNKQQQKQRSQEGRKKKTKKKFSSLEERGKDAQ
jgi:hypothetical protein